MFPSMTECRPPKRSLRELVRGAMDTALELVTLGEASAPARLPPAPPPTPPPPPRRPLGHPTRRDPRPAALWRTRAAGAAKERPRRGRRSAPRRFIARLTARPDHRARRR